MTKRNFLSFPLLVLYLIDIAINSNSDWILTTPKQSFQVLMTDLFNPTYAHVNNNIEHWSQLEKKPLTYNSS